MLMAHPIQMFRRKLPGALWLLLLVASVVAAQTTSRRPMTFMDIIQMRTAGSPSISPDGKLMLYTLSVPDWKAGKSFMDIHLVSLDEGAASTRRMTFTRDKNETSPRFSRDSRLFAFLSNREAQAASPNQNQLYVMRVDGGEARKISDAKDGVASFAFSRDGRWLAFSAGKSGEQQIWIVPLANIDTEEPEQLTKHSTPITSWQFSPDSSQIYFLAPETFDKANKERKEKKFDVRIRNEESSLIHLWAFKLDSRQERRLTSGDDYSVSDVTCSKDGKWIGFRGTPNDRYMRTVTETSIYGDLYLLEISSGKIERLTDNKEIAESQLRFSPDNSTVAFTASDDFTYFRNRRVYLRPVTDRGGNWRKLASDFDGNADIAFWSKNGKTIYFDEGIRATNQLLALSTETGKVTQLSREKGLVAVTYDDDAERLLISYSDPATPPDLYTVQSIEGVGKRASWKPLTNANPQANNIAVGESEEIEWRSTDGTMVGGVLVKPLGYEPGKRYPLIVQIHGGPAGASILNYNAGYGYYSHIYAAAGYACLLPNYRGSSNYGEKFRMQISGDYFRQGYEDIIAGVDHLIAIGLVDGSKLGAMGWSAGGHWSNWILTHTDRFKAISSGAGAVNWISMYAQSDIQRNREFYYQGQPYDRFEHYWDVSPLKYIKNAKTPTLIHVVDGDPRVPRPQSEELHMALKKIGVPTELFVYPGSTHGITEPRNQLVKMVSEFNWFEKWIKGKDTWLNWNELLDTLKDPKGEEKKEDPAGSANRPK